MCKKKKGVFNMQVNNNVQSPNFGMALKIKNGAKDALKNCSMETIEKLQKAGEELKDTKFYHVTVGDDLSAKLTADKDAYFGLFNRHDIYTARNHGMMKSEGKMVEDPRIILIGNTCGRTEFGVGRYIPYGETQPFFDVWGPLVPYNKVNDLPELTKVAKILDGVAAEKAYQAAAEEAVKAAENAKVSKAVDSLLDSFGE